MSIPDKDKDALYSALFALCPTEATQQRLAQINNEERLRLDCHSWALRMLIHTMLAMEEARWSPLDGRDYAWKSFTREEFEATMIKVMEGMP